MDTGPCRPDYTAPEGERNPRGADRPSEESCSADSRAGRRVPGNHPPGETLLALDVGLRAGLALYGREGRLLRYGSRNFGSRGRMRQAVRGLLVQCGDLRWLFAEGGRGLAAPWLRAAQRRGAEIRVVAAETWRPSLLLPREQRTGAAAKAHADRLARRVIEWSGLARPRSLRHDAAEAILVGLWAVAQVGWLVDEPPIPLR